MCIKLSQSLSSSVMLWRSVSRRSHCTPCTPTRSVILNGPSAPAQPPSPPSCYLPAVSTATLTIGTMETTGEEKEAECAEREKWGDNCILSLSCTSREWQRYFFSSLHYIKAAFLHREKSNRTQYTCRYADTSPYMHEKNFFFVMTIHCTKPAVLLR